MNRWVFLGIGVPLFGIGFATAAYEAWRHHNPAQASSAAPVRASDTATRPADLVGKLGQTVTVSGRVDALTRDFASNPEPLVFLKFGTEGEAQCFFPRFGSAAPDWYATIERGQVVVIRGRLVKIGTEVHLTNCELVDSPR